MKSMRGYLLLLGAILLLTSLLPLVRFFGEASDIWWTPAALAVPLPQAKDRVEVYVDGVALADLAAQGRLQLVGETGASQVEPSSVRLRFNNWDRVRAQRIPVLISAGVGIGVAATALLLGLFGWGLQDSRQSPP